MEYPVTLLLPENLYRQAAALAHAQQTTIGEILVKQLSIAQPLLRQSELDPEQTQLQREVEAYKVLHPHLLAHYPGQWVGIYAGQLLDHDLDEDALLARLDQRWPNALVLVRRVEVEADREIYIPSFRLVA